jgi:hypothetical protein
LGGEAAQSNEKEGFFLAAGGEKQHFAVRPRPSFFASGRAENRFICSGFGSFAAKTRAKERRFLPCCRRRETPGAARATTPTA